MRSIRSLLGCLLLLGFLVGCGPLHEGDDTDDGSPTVQAPQIISFGVEEIVSNAGGESFVTLAWEVSGTNPKLSISPAPGTVTGTRITLPLGATTYTLTATNSSGKTSKSASATVNEDHQPASPDDGDEQPVPPGEDPETPSDPAESSLEPG